MLPRFLCLLAYVFFPWPAFAATAPAARPFEIIRNCTLKDDRWNDGDSFHAILPLGDPFRPNENLEIVVRLYFVDTVEAESKYADRLKEQAAYFGITEEQSLELAHEAADFTARRLTKPFTIYTNGRPAMGLSAVRRIYAFVFTAENADLNAALILNGLARIHGTSTKIPNGWTSKEYHDRLLELEAQARAAGAGGWRFAKPAARATARPVSAPPKPAAPTVAPSTPASPAAPATGGYVASKKSAAFHKPECMIRGDYFPREYRQVCHPRGSDCCRQKAVRELPSVKLSAQRRHHSPRTPITPGSWPASAPPPP